MFKRWSHWINIWGFFFCMLIAICFCIKLLLYSCSYSFSCYLLDICISGSISCSSLCYHCLSDKCVLSSKYWTGYVFPNSAIQNRDLDKELSKDEINVELKAELERLLSSNKMKRNQITQLQNDLKDCQKALEEYKQLLKATKESEVCFFTLFIK